MKYQIYGRSETGSDIIEYLFHELSIDYEFIEIIYNFVQLIHTTRVKTRIMFTFQYR